MADRRFARDKRYRYGRDDGQQARDQPAHRWRQPDFKEPLHDDLPGKGRGDGGIETAGNQRYAKQGCGKGRAQNWRNQAVGIRQFRHFMVAGGIEYRGGENQDGGIDHQGKNQRNG